jgi:hypothetical protein
MKRIFPLLAAPALLVTLGFGQTSAPVSNAAPTSVKGCLAGTDGKYTVAEDGTTQNFKISSSTIDLKAHVGHDVELLGKQTIVTPSSGPSDNTIAVTGLNMIAEQCATPKASSMPMNDSTPATASSTTAPVAASAPPADAAPASKDPQATTTTTTTTATATTAPASSTAVADPMPNTVATSPAKPADVSSGSDTTATTSTNSTTVSSAPVIAREPVNTEPPQAQTTTIAPEKASAPRTTSDMEPTTASNDASDARKLPETATSLPLLGLLGLGLLGLGLMAWKLPNRKFSIS